MVNLILSGMMGQMGSMISHDILTKRHINLVGAIVASHEIEKAKGVLARYDVANIPVVSDIRDIYRSEPVDVFLDFSVMAATKINLPEIASRKIPSIIGVSGFAEDDYGWMRSMSEQYDVAILLVPNFSIGILLVKKMAALARAYFPKVELVETHHDRKRDAPSGTSLDIATMLAKIDPPPAETPQVEELDLGSRGMDVKDVKIHSLRLPGVIARQSILFSRKGEVLSIEHDTTSREAFLAGIYFTIENIYKMKGFNIGLESIMEI
jgi:4-hydroxy-tetrahydrodipicolinate reductase